MGWRERGERGERGEEKWDFLPCARASWRTSTFPNVIDARSEISPAFICKHVSLGEFSTGSNEMRDPCSIAGWEMGAWELTGSG
jgi:hypothetical protein